LLKFTDNKNEQMKRVFWTLFVAMAGQVLARVVDPGTAQQVVGIITGMGVKPSFRFTPVEECWDQGIQTRRENKPLRASFPSTLSGSVPENPGLSPFSVPMRNTPI
jgi:hypothetical protein